MMLYVSPYLATIGLSIVPAVTIFAIGFGRYIKNLSKKVQDVLAEATDVNCIPKYIQTYDLIFYVKRWPKRS